MAFPENPILKAAFDTWAGSWLYEIFDEEDDPGVGNEKDLNIIKSEGLYQIAGASKFDVKKYIYPTQELFTILDKDDYLFNKLQNQKSSRFRLDIKLEGNLINRLNILTEKIDSVITDYTSDLPLTCFDGLTNLKDHDFDLTGYYTIFNFFETVLNKVGHGLQIHYMFNLKHLNADGTYLPDLARIPVDQILSKEKNRNYYNVLEHVLSVLELKLFQANGAWWIQQINLKNAIAPTYTKGLPPALEIKSESTFDPVVSLNSELLKQSKKTTLPVHSPIIHTVNVLPDDAGGTRNYLFDSWNGPVTEPIDWELLSGSVSRVDANDGLRIDQTGIPKQLKQIQPRVYRGGDYITIDIDFTIYDDIDEFAVFDVEFATIKLVDIKGGTNYYIVNSGATFTTQTTSARLDFEVNTSVGVNQYDININKEVLIPIGFTGYIEVLIYCGDHTFDPDNDLTYEFNRIDFDHFEIKFKNDAVESDWVYTHYKDNSKNEVEYSPTISDTNYDNYINAIQFLYDSSENIWLSTFEWNGGDALIYRKSRLILSSVSEPSKGLKLNLDRDTISIDLRNSILYSGVYYNPFYISWDKVNNLLQVNLNELNNDVTDPNQTLQIIEK
ncbi:MAG: hypothetical protein ABJI69_09285 [Balneola sp.]